MRIDHLSSWYPPAKWVFLPLYKWFRKELGVASKNKAFAAVMASSGVLHLLIIGGGAYILGSPVWFELCIYFILVYGLLTYLSAKIG